ncbi:MAG: hypothetical protein WAV26_06275 [Candidatus Deferrimicrobium sp.]
MLADLSDMHTPEAEVGFDQPEAGSHTGTFGEPEILKARQGFLDGPFFVRDIIALGSKRGLHRRKGNVLPGRIIKKETFEK